jgi:hypothetical protein
LTGGQGVAGSNPVYPTTSKKPRLTTEAFSSVTLSLVILSEAPLGAQSKDSDNHCNDFAYKYKLIDRPLDAGTMLAPGFPVGAPRETKCTTTMTTIASTSNSDMSSDIGARARFLDGAPYGCFARNDTGGGSANGAG